jgi:hypothetical protein
MKRDDGKKDGKYVHGTPRDESTDEQSKDESGEPHAENKKKAFKKKHSPNPFNGLPEDETDSEEEQEHHKETRERKKHVEIREEQKAKKQPRWADPVEKPLRRAPPGKDEPRRPHTTATGRDDSPQKKPKSESQRPQTVPGGPSKEKGRNTRPTTQGNQRPVTHAGHRPTTRGDGGWTRPATRGGEITEENKKKKQKQEMIYGTKPENDQPIRPITRGSRRPKVGCRKYKNDIQEYVRIFEMKKLASQQILKTRKMHLYSTYRGNVDEKKMVKTLSSEFNQKARLRKDPTVENGTSTKPQKFSNMTDFESYLHGE